ncbi:hypothetical protein GW796_06405 [archaeon]|nr:hypothetical protein [archaeon]
MFLKRINAYSAIQNQADFQSLNKIELVVSIYEKIISHIKKSICSIENKNTEQKLFHIDKALQIIELGLISYLDISQGDVAKKLQDFYSISMLDLVKSNIQNNSKDLQIIADNFNEIKKSWEFISKDTIHQH